MKSAICAVLAVMCLLAVMGTGFAADVSADDVNIFDFVNMYGDTVTPPDMSDADLRALISAQNETLITEYATYTLVQSVFDGCTGCLMVKVTPNEPEKTLLMSAYMWEMEDIVPLADEPDSMATFAELAGDRRIIVAGLSLSDKLGYELTYDASFSEMYFKGGAMFLFARFNYSIISDAARDIEFTVRESVYGEDIEEHKLTARLIPTVSTETAFAQGVYDFDGITITGAMLMRSPLGIVLRMNGALDAELDDARLEMLKYCIFELVESEPDFLSGGGIMFLSADGEIKYPDEAEPGDEVHIEMMLRAGDRLPDKLTIGLNTFTREVVPVNTLEFEVSNAD